jgi:hypothetical protein
VRLSALNARWKAFAFSIPDMKLDLDWDVELDHRVGAEDRLCGIDVFYEFNWLDVFPDERTQFKNGKSLATFVKHKCPAGRTPALLLTLRPGVRQGLIQTDLFSVFVVNLAEYRAAEGDAALSYLAGHLDVDITEIEQLQHLAESADPHLVRTFIESSLDIGHIAEWVVDNNERIEQLRELVDSEQSEPSDLTSTLTNLALLSELSPSDIAALTAFLRSSAAHNLGDVVTDREVLARLYATSPESFREAIRSDASARDVIALSHRKAVVDRFRTLLRDQDAFEEEQQATGGGRETVWQRFFEENPWILGVGLAGQLLTAWDDARLEQVVSGFSVAGPGKRTDALLRTAGRIRALVFTEIKHHQTSLLSGSAYRPGCWPPSLDLAGGVTQLQQTVDLAVENIRKRLPDTDEDGTETGEATWLIRPRSFLILGQLDELRGTTGVHAPKYQSFELYRRNLYEPEIITFDELLARAEWHVELAELEA